MKTPQIALQDISIHVPLISVLIAFLIVLSMENKWHLFLLVPLVVCIFGLYLLYNPTIYMRQTDMFLKEIVVKDIILSICFFTICISLILDSDNKKHYQTFLRGTAIMSMSILAFFICFSSIIKNVYFEMLAVLLVVSSFILSFVWVSMDEEGLRKGIYIASVCLFFFFLIYYISSASILQKKKQNLQDEFPVMAFDLKQLPRAY